MAARKSAQPKKHKPTDAELANDPSLRWCPYRSGELVWSDAHATEMRFLRYEPAGVVLATQHGIAEVKGHVDPLTVRRPSVNQGYCETNRKLDKDTQAAYLAAQRLRRGLSTMTE